MFQTRCACEEPLRTVERFCDRKAHPLAKAADPRVRCLCPHCNKVIVIFKPDRIDHQFVRLRSSLGEAVRSKV